VRGGGGGGAVAVVGGSGCGGWRRGLGWVDLSRFKSS
jgi:hypothetical protein